MMKKKFNSGKIFFIILFFSLSLQSIFSNSGSSQSETVNLEKWTVAAEKFVLRQGQVQNSISEGIAEAIPKNILENLNQYFIRNIKPDEELERLRYDYRKKRQSLYLQLSGEYQKRDVLSLSYTGKKLDRALKEQDKKIKDIEQKISKNLEELEKAEIKEQQRIEYGFDADSIEAKSNPVERFFDKIFDDDKSVFKSEEINIFNGDSDSLYSPSIKLKTEGYESPLFNEEMHKKGINAYLTGEIATFSGYISVSVDIYIYPGGKKIGSVMEIGALNDLEFVVSSIVSQLTTILTNSMPVSVNFIITPYDIKSDVKLYIDDILQTNLDEGNVIITSGVHNFQVTASGYKSLATSYYFEGNTHYNIEINLEEQNEKTIFIKSVSPVIGDIYMNNILSEYIDDEKSRIIINDSEILGSFISEDGKTSYFYIPENLNYNQNYVSINPKVVDRNEYIEKRRKWMYGSYSGFIVSLIPAFITKGYFLNQKSLYERGDYNTAVGWAVAANVFTGVSIGLGAFWVFELVRYLLAADSLLPEKAKKVELLDYND